MNGAKGRLATDRDYYRRTRFRVVAWPELQVAVCAALVGGPLTAPEVCQRVAGTCPEAPLAGPLAMTVQDALDRMDALGRLRWDHKTRLYSAAVASRLEAAYLLDLMDGE